MNFVPLPLPGAFVIEPARRKDERGFFARTWSRAEFAARGLDPRIEECSISFNPRRGTLRGMHYQAEPHAEAKLIRCTAGAIHDVIIDLRPDSPTHTRWAGVELTAANRRLLFVPEGFAHGFLTLADDTEVFYQISAGHRPEAARGVRWNDPAFAIHWPDAPVIISPRDASYPDYAPVRADAALPR